MRVDQMDKDIIEIAEWHDSRGQKLNGDFLRKVAAEINRLSLIADEFNKNQKHSVSNDFATYCPLCDSDNTGAEFKDGLHTHYCRQCGLEFATNADLKTNAETQIAHKP